MPTRATRGASRPAPPIGIPNVAPRPPVGGGRVATTISGPASASAPATRGAGGQGNPNRDMVSGGSRGGPAISGPAGGNYAPAVRGGRVAIADTPNWRDTYTPGDFSKYPGNSGRYLVDPAGNFLEGDPSAYARDYAGLYPSGTAGDYSDAQMIADKNVANNNYGAGMAEADAQEGNINTAFSEFQSLLGRNKNKSLGSLANSMADRGLTNSGIFLNSTNDVNQNYVDQLSSATSSRDTQLGAIERNRVNLSNILAQALAEAERGAYTRALDSWRERQAAGLKLAQDRLNAIGLT